jgi:hypothetical protein
MTDTQQKIKELTDNLCSFLIEKNKRYGDSALSQINIFCKKDLDISDFICIRLNDKISRVSVSKTLRKNDIVDLIGYLILLSISKDWIDFSEFLD